jgi:hypothetical protein
MSIVPLVNVLREKEDVTGMKQSYFWPYFRKEEGK